MGPVAMRDGKAEQAALGEVPEISEWQRAHGELERFAKSRAGEDFREGQLLLRALRSSAHACLGFGSFIEYVERLLGYGPRLTHEKLRVAEALEMLPKLAGVLEQGELTWSAVREVTRVATDVTEQEWLDAVRGRTVREIEKLVSGHKRGARPGDATDARLARHVLRFEVAGETLALFREALSQLRKRTGQSLDDDAALLLMARDVLGGPTDDGRSSYQIALTVCERCRRGEQLGHGDAVEIAPEIIAMCECDAQHVGPIHDDDTSVHVMHDGLSVGETHVGQEVETPAHVNEATNSEVPLPARVPKAKIRKRKRARQSTPPAIRRLVFLRDHRRCVVPGCSNTTFLDAHHVRPQHEGGGHDPENLACMCSVHHRAVHRGCLVIIGGASSGFVFRHADGTPYGGAVSSLKAEVVSAVFGGLVRLGFRETAARQAIERVLAKAHDIASKEELLRAALELLTT